MLSRRTSAYLCCLVALSWGVLGIVGCAGPAATGGGGDAEVDEGPNVDGEDGPDDEQPDGSGEGDGTDGADVPAGGAVQVGSPPEGQFYFGVFPGDESVDALENDVSLAGVRSFEAAVGTQVAWVYFSHNWYQGRAFPEETAAWIREAGAIPFIRLMLRNDADQDHADPIYNLEAILSGEFDGDLADWGTAAAAFGTPLLVEWGTECNGQWFSWNGVWNGAGKTDGFGDPAVPDGPERFVATYRHIVDLIEGEGADNITWVFHVNAPDVPDDEWNGFENYYPGDDYVDWLAISVYGAGDPVETEVETFRDQLDFEYERLAGLADDKPVIVAEMGTSANNAEMPPEQWTDAALADLFASRWPRVMGFAWWNEGWPNDDDPAHDTNMVVQDTTELAETFQDQFDRHRDRLSGPLDSEGAALSDGSD
ncbi:MAG: beta-mannanase [bacterium]|nr:beta-mannanase [bacterium]